MSTYVKLGGRVSFANASLRHRSRPTAATRATRRSRSRSFRMRPLRRQSSRSRRRVTIRTRSREMDLAASTQSSLGCAGSTSLERSIIIIPYMYAITIRISAMIRSVQCCETALRERRNGGACFLVVGSDYCEESISGLDIAHTLQGICFAWWHVCTSSFF